MKHIRLLTIVLIALLALAMLPLAAQDDVEANKALVTRYIEEIVNGGNLELMEELFADDFAFLDVLVGKLNREKYAESIRSGQTAWGALTSNYFLLGQGDLIAQVYLWTGTRYGRTYGIPEVDILHIKDGKITNLWSVWDMTLGGQQADLDDPVRVPEGWLPTPGSSDSMPEDNTALVERALAIWESGDISASDEVFADDLVFHFPLGISTQSLGRDGLGEYITWMHSVMPDFEIKRGDEIHIAEGDLVVYHYGWEGNFHYEFLGQPRSALYVADAADIYRIADGKIAEVWWNWMSSSQFVSIDHFAPPADA